MYLSITVRVIHHLLSTSSCFTFVQILPFLPSQKSLLHLLYFTLPGVSRVFNLLSYLNILISDKLTSYLKKKPKKTSLYFMSLPTPALYSSLSVKHFRSCLHLLSCKLSSASTFHSKTDHANATNDCSITKSKKLSFIILVKISTTFKAFDRSWKNFLF